MFCLPLFLSRCCFFYLWFWLRFLAILFCDCCFYEVWFFVGLGHHCSSFCLLFIARLFSRLYHFHTHPVFFCIFPSFFSTVICF
ncbi:hypothetical protein FPQ18DRAFT_343249 [Pyronema domesticum]|nr:hypothetical protein FPQ18DRAFT_343249 [Pyronema domesticum]